MSICNFGFEGRGLVVNVSVPVHCLPLTFSAGVSYHVGESILINAHNNFSDTVKIVIIRPRWTIKMLSNVLVPADKT